MFCSITISICFGIVKASLANMVFILYGNELSPPVRAVFMAMKALGLKFEFRNIDLMGSEHLKEEYVRKNPQHTVPVLETEDGRYIWDSHAIMAYLVGRYSKTDTLYPKDHYLRALVDQRLHFDSGVLFTALRHINVSVALIIPI